MALKAVDTIGNSTQNNFGYIKNLITSKNCRYWGLTQKRLPLNEATFIEKEVTSHSVLFKTLRVSINRGSIASIRSPFIKRARISYLSTQ